VKQATKREARAGLKPAPTEAAEPHGALWSATLPVIAAIVVYLPALRNGFIWDDPTVLLQMRAIHSIGDLLVMPPIIPKFYYRPFIFVTYLLDRAVNGETPFWFHASVIGWHALNTLLVFVLARRLFPTSLTIAGAGAVLFAVFPTHVESVAWMAGRSDVIVCTFILLTVLLFMDRERPWAIWLGGVTYLLALLSKEMAVACLIVVPVIDIAGRRLVVTRYIPLWAATAVYFVMRRASLGAFVGGMATGAAPAALGLDVVRAVGFYVARAVVPLGLCAYVPAVPDNIFYVLLGILAPLLAVSFVLVAWRRGRWQVAVLLTWFFVMLAPSLTVIIRRSASAVLADRYLYAPTVASCILAAWAIVTFVESRRLAARWSIAAVAALSGLFAIQTIPYSRVWTDNLSFWSDVAAKVPDDALPHREVAAALQERGKLAEAESELRRAAATTSTREGQLMTYSNLGNLYRRQQRYDEAQAAFEAAMKIAPHPALYHNLGMTLMAKIEQEQKRGDQAAVVRDIVKAREAFEHALAIGSTPGAAQTFLEWNAAKTHALLAQVLFSLGDRGGARDHLETALRLEPTGPLADATRQYMKKLEQ